MNISQEHRAVLVKEIRLVSEQVQNPRTSARDKIYFFSAVHGTMQRIYGLEYDDDLFFAAYVLNTVFSSINNAVSDVDQDARFPVDEVVHAMGSAIVQLADRIESDSELIGPLKRFVRMSSLGTGNGYYLWRTGRLTLD